MLALALSALAGVVALHALPGLPGGGWLALLALCAAPIARLPFAPYALAAVAGLLWAGWRAELALADRLPPALEGRDLEVIGRIVSLPERSADRTRFDLSVESPVGLPSRLRLSWYGERPTLAAAERWRLRVKLRRPRGFANPGGYDYERALLVAGIGATGYVRQDPANGRLDVAPRLGVLVARAAVAERLLAIVGDRPSGGLILGLAVASRDRISPQQWTVLRRTGTAHLMAISGLHIGLVAALCYWVGQRLGRWRRRQRAVAADIGCAAAAAAATGYALLAGMSVPTQRALLMLAVWFGCLALRRELGVGRAPGLALLAVLLHDPLAPLAVGFWLSFGAIGCLALVGTRRLGSPRRLLEMARAQWAVTIGLAPMLLVAFGQVSLVGPLANLALIPLFSVAVVPLVLGGALLVFLLPPVGGVLLGTAALLLELAWPALSALSATPAATAVLAPPPLLLASLTAAVALLLAPAGRGLRPLALLLLAPALLWRAPQPEHGGFELTVLDVGQGLAAVVRTRSHTLVYDGGPRFQSGGDTGRLVVQPFLEHRGWRPDMLLVSHEDVDHAGGAAALLAEMPVGTLLAAPGVAFDDWRLQRCRRGMSWRWDGVQFELLHPPAGSGWEGNDGSCVLRVSGFEVSALLTGDIEAAGERALVAAGGLSSEIVIVPHHGSRTSSTAAFVAATGARVAVFATGYANRWGFPQPDVVQRWREAGALTLDTAESGALMLRASADGTLSIAAFRRVARRYWR